jgi:TetR/AcrR family transcriptional regulator
MSTKKLKSVDPGSQRRPPERSGLSNGPKGERESARDRILAAATHEFAAKGYAGARVDAIARAAGANKQLVYYYFDSKKGLYETVRQHFVDATISLTANASSTLSKRVTQFTVAALSEELAPLIRLNQWAALASTDGDSLSGMADPNLSRRFIDPFRRDQQVGNIRPELDPDLVLLMLMAVTTYPRAYPQVVRAVTGQEVADPAFQKRFINSMIAFTSALGPT